MMNAALGRCSGPDRCLQRGDGNAGVHRSADGVADHLARPGIEDRRQTDEAAGNGDVASPAGSATSGLLSPQAAPKCGEMPKSPFMPRECGLEAKDVEPGSPAIGQPRTHQRPGTMPLYAAEWLAFVAWCRVAKRVALPADAETFAAYLLASAPGTSRGTLGRKQAAIRAMHRQHNLPVPAIDAAARAAVRLVASLATVRASRMLPSGKPRATLVQIALMCSLDLAGLRDRTLLLLAAAGSMAHDELLELQREQLRFVEAEVELRLAWAMLEVVLVPRDTAAGWPVRALEAWLHASTTRFGPVW